MKRTSIITHHASQIKPSEILTFHAALARWYKTHGRHDLPWRTTDNPYHIWISEVMLQQTQVRTVLERYYFPFLKTFPSIESLAKAPREKVLKAWEGLGYYTRARNLHEAAKKVLSEGGLSLVNASLADASLAALKAAPSRRSVASPAASRLAPSATHPTLQSLLALPGIGRNTAHAILAFAYHQPVPVLEANVKRVVARICALKTPVEKELWKKAEYLMGVTGDFYEPSARSVRAQKLERTGAYVSFEHARDKQMGQKNRPMSWFDYNQAMMDLGALICTPKAPQCKVCPASSICKGKKSPESYPQKKARKSTPTRHVNIKVMEDAAGRFYLESRNDRLLGGLYGFPQVPLAPSSPRRRGPMPRMSAQSVTWIPACAGMTRIDGGQTIGIVTHSYSHFKLVGEVLYQKLASKKNSADWHSREEIKTLPLSKLDHKVLALVENHHSARKKRTKAGKTHGVA